MGKSGFCLGFNILDGQEAGNYWSLVIGHWSLVTGHWSLVRELRLNNISSTHPPICSLYWDFILTLIPYWRMVCVGGRYNKLDT